jgi:hypothetical protein
LRGYACSFEEILPLITQEIREKGYGLIIIDPTYKILGNADENKANDITRMMNALESVAFETKAAVVTSNHYSKGNKSQSQDGDRISGSGVFQRDPDSLLEFVDQQDSADDNNILAVRARLREHKPMKPFCVEWDGTAIFNVSGHDASKLKKNGGRPSAYSADDLYNVLDGEMTSGEWLEAATEECGIKGQTFYTLKKELETSGRVTKQGKKFVRAESGVCGV